MTVDPAVCVAFDVPADPRITVNGPVPETTAITSESIRMPLQVVRLVPDARLTLVALSVRSALSVVFDGKPAKFGHPFVGAILAIHEVRLDTPVALTVTDRAGSPGATEGRVNVVCGNAEAARMSKKIICFMLIL